MQKIRKWERGIKEHSALYLFILPKKKGPLRVWLRNENVPGLAMTRSFGDLVAESVGVIYKVNFFFFLLNTKIKLSSTLLIV